MMLMLISLYADADADADADDDADDESVGKFIPISQQMQQGLV